MNPEGSGSSESALIETVQQQLLQGGVKAEQAAMVARIVVTSVETFHSGPLPSVETFSGYEKACPGAARDILEMAKSSQVHLQFMDKAQILGQISLNLLGIISAVIILCLMMYAALQAALAGHEYLAAVLGSGTGLALVAGVFVRNYFAGKNSSIPASSDQQKIPRKKPTKIRA